MNVFLVMFEYIMEMMIMVMMIIEVGMKIVG